MRGTNRPGLIDRDERIEKPPERTPNGFQLSRQLAYAEKVGQVSRILSRDVPLTVAQISEQTGIRDSIVYKILKEFSGQMYEQVARSGAGNCGLWKWRLSWRHE
jgi:hypothetical protein